MYVPFYPFSSAEVYLDPKILKFSNFLSLVVLEGHLLTDLIFFFLLSSRIRKENDNNIFMYNLYPYKYEDNKWKDESIVV